MKKRSWLRNWLGGGAQDAAATQVHIREWLGRNTYRHEQFTDLRQLVA